MIRALPIALVLVCACKKSEPATKAIDPPNDAHVALADGGDAALDADPGLAFSPAPRKITTAARVACTLDSTFALLADGTVQHWGFVSGEYRDDAIPPPPRCRPTPKPLAAPFKPTLLAGDAWACAASGDDVVCFGTHDGDGFLGTVDATASKGAFKVPGLASLLVTGRYGCALDKSGGVTCWQEQPLPSGAAAKLPERMLRRIMPPTKIAGLDKVAALGGRNGHFFAVKSDGSLLSSLVPLGTRCSKGGECFDESPCPASGVCPAKPLKKIPVSGVTQAEGDPNNVACVRTKTAQVLCWGSNGDGQLGDGTNIDRRTPAPVKDLSDVVEIAVGLEHACARKGDGSVWCWGRNVDGRLGDGTAAPRNVPVRVIGLPAVDAIVAGSAHTCAHANDGGIWCWGSNEHGRLAVLPPRVAGGCVVE